MAILNAQVSNIGETGQVPKFIYISTNDSSAGVTATGYLNDLVSQGFSLSDTEMALVSMKAHPSDRASQTGLYTVSFAGGNWSLIPLASSSASGWLLTGNAPSGPAVLGTLNNEEISFRANNVDYMLFEPSVPRLSIIPDVVQVISSLVTFDTDTLDLEATSSLGLGTVSAPVIIIGNNATPTNSTEIASQVIKFTHIPAATAADVLYYDSSTNAISYGAGGGGGGSDWALAGNTGSGHVLGLTDTNDFRIVSNSVDRIVFHGTNQDVVIQGGVPASPGTIPAGSVALVAQGFVAGFGGGGVNFSATTGDANLSADAGNLDLSASGGNATLDGQNGVTISTSAGSIDITSATGNVDIGASTGHLTLSATSGDFNITDLASSVTAQALYYNSGSGRVTYGTASSGGVSVVDIQAFTTAGAGSYIPTAGMKYCIVEVFGAGGSGASPANPSAGNSGGAGGYARKVLSASDIGAGTGFTIGAGGASIFNANGNNGGNTSFGAFMTANGGDGGVGSNGNGGAGGTATGGTINLVGGQGYGSVEVTTPGGPFYMVGAGGASLYGGTSSFNADSDTAGGAGRNPGEGGTGTANVSTTMPSGAGSDGAIFITEFI